MKENNEQIESSEELLEHGYEHFKIKVDPGQTQIRIDKYLMSKLEKISRNRLQNGIKSGNVFVDDKIVKSNFKVKPNQVIKVLLAEEPDKYDVIPEEMPLNIVYEDDMLMVVNKEPGMVVHPGFGNRSGTLVNGLRHYFQNNALPVMEGNTLDRPGIVHRIDKLTSGLLVVAKTQEAMTHLAKQFFDHSIERTYQAIIWGELEDDEGVVHAHIGRHPRHRILMHAFPDGDEGKEAITHYKVLDRMYYVSLIECKLETGRTHQIRVHMQHKGHPIFNDIKYGGDKIVKGTVFSKFKSFVHNTFLTIPRHALHAKTLGFIHPKTNEKMYFDSELPEDMQDVIVRWKKYVNNSKDKLSHQ